MIPLAALPPSGTFKDVPFIHILRLIRKKRQSGILTVQLWKIEKLVHFHEGKIIFATSNYANDRLGEVFLKAGKINFKQYDIASEIFEKTRKKKGMILLEQGFVQPKDLFEMLLLQVKEIVLSLFYWEDAQYSFRETTRPVDDAIGINIDPNEIIFTGVYQITDWTRLVDILPPLDSLLERVSEVPTDTLVHSTEEREVLALVDNERSVRDILMLSSKRSLAWAQILNLLIAMGRVLFRASPQSAFQETRSSVGEGAGTSAPEKASAPRKTKEWKKVSEPEQEETPEEKVKKIESIYQRVDAQNYYDVLGISSKATSDEIKGAYTKLAKRYHPDRYMDKAFAGILKQVEHIFIAIRKAYDTLSVEAQRKHYDETLYQQSTEYQARQGKQHIQYLLQRGEAAFSGNDFKMALYFFEEALRLMPEGGDKAAVYLRYGKMLSNVPGQLHAATDILEKCAALDPANAEPHLELGLIYSKAGLARKAMTAFQGVLQRDPRNKTALAELARLKEQQKKH